MAAETIVMGARRGKKVPVKKSSSSFGGDGSGGKRAPGASQTTTGVIEQVGFVGDFFTGEGLNTVKILIPLWALFVAHSIGMPLPSSRYPALQSASLFTASLLRLPPLYPWPVPSLTSSHISPFLAPASPMPSAPTCPGIF